MRVCYCYWRAAIQQEAEECIRIHRRELRDQILSGHANRTTEHRRIRRYFCIGGAFVPILGDIRR